MKTEPPFRANQTTSEKNTVMGLCIECALRHHDFHELIGRGTDMDGLPETLLPQVLIDGRRHVLLSYALTRQERCTECNRTTPNLYVHMVLENITRASDNEVSRV